MKKISPKLEFIKKNNFEISVTFSVLVAVLSFVFLGKPIVSISLALGIVAASLSQNGEHPKSKIRSCIIMIFCFALMSYGTTITKYFTIINVIWLGATTLVFTLVGGYSVRMKKISYGSILIVLYSAISFQANLPWWIIPTSLCAGALFYDILVIIILYRYPFNPITDELSQGYDALSNYLRNKSKLLTDTDVSHMRNKLADANIGVVASLERCKELLNIYSNDVDESKLKVYLNYFIILQNLHERAASTHGNYSKLSNIEGYKDVIEGFKELLHQLSHATKLVSKCLINGNTYVHPIAIHWILRALSERITLLPENNRNVFELFYYNLKRSSTSLARLYDEKYMSGIPRLQQSHNSVRMYLVGLFSKFSSITRYSLRLTTCFVIGKNIGMGMGIPFNDWIPLTIFFVSQTTYKDTRKRLSERIFGTIVGIFMGAFLLKILPTLEGQLLMLFLSIFLFFYWLKRQYSVAVVFITIFVLVASQIMMQKGYQTIFPRVLSTLVGGVLAYLMTRFMWPDWQYKLLPILSNEALKANAVYYSSIINNAADLNFRIARREAHLADNKLTQARQSILVEPKKHREQLSKATRLIYLNHALLSHLSALSINVDNNRKDDKLINEIKEYLEFVFYNPSQTNKLISYNEKLKVRIEDMVNDYNYRLYYNISEVLEKIIRENFKKV